MQTFLPYPDFRQSIMCLDDRRLGKQRVEAKQIIDIITGKTKSKAWVNHPAVLMWKGYDYWLKSYYNECLYQWKFRGFKNTKLKKFRIRIITNPYHQHVPALPRWLGREEFHASHRSNLLRKSKFYKRFLWLEKDNLPYVWPVRIKK